MNSIGKRAAGDPVTSSFIDGPGSKGDVSWCLGNADPVGEANYLIFAYKRKKRMAQE